MASLEDIYEEDRLYICDNCGHMFKAREVALEDAATNLKMLTPPVPPIFIDKDGIIKSGGTKAEEGDRVLACPKCKTIHLFGFSSVGG